MSTKYRKKPVMIEAEQWTGRNREDKTSLFHQPGVNIRPEGFEVATMEGTMRGELGDWLIRGIKGELYPCKDEIFQATYEPAI